MFNFNLEKTLIYQRVKWERSVCFRFADFFYKFFLVLYIIALIVFLYGFVPVNFTPFLNRKLLGLSLLFLTMSVFSWLKKKFLETELKNPEIKQDIKKALEEPEKYNLAEFLDFESAQAVFEAIKYQKSKKITQVDSSILLYFLLKRNPELEFIFYRGLLNPKEVNGILKENLKVLKKIGKKSLHLEEVQKEESRDLFSNSFQQSVLEALKIAAERGGHRVEESDLVAGLAKHDSIFKKILIKSKLKEEDIKNLSFWLHHIKSQQEELKKFWSLKNLLSQGSLGKEWASGYTITLDRFSSDLTKIYQQRGFPEVIGHDKEVEQLERILAREEGNNVLIVGEPGTGRKYVIKEFAEKSNLGETLPGLNYKRIVKLDLPSLLSYTESVKGSGDLLEIVFNEILSAGNIILVIPDLHHYAGGKVSAGAIDISAVLGPYLNLSEFKLIATTSFRGLHKYIEQNPSILNLFEKVEVTEPPEDKILIILQNVAARLEAKYDKFISYQALRDVISYAEKYIQDVPFPKKAVDLLEDTVVCVSQKKEDIVLPKHVAEVVHRKTEIPVGKIEKEEKDILLNLEELIHQRIINQETAVKKISEALRRARSEISIRDAPMGSFLFLGPTGVGKTETSKSLAEIYFGSEDKMIRLDMSEFQNTEDIARLIGSPGEEGLLTTEVKENPFSLVLLDEIEKAHPKILNLFLQVLDEGHITDGLGRKVNFKNTIIIATSNAGYRLILQALKEEKNISEIKDELFDYLFQEGYFRPEFINRFDAVVIFEALSKKNLLDIADLLLKKLRKNLAKKDITFQITKELKEKIVNLSYDPKFGAREMKRVVQDNIGNVVATALLSDQIEAGDTIEIEPEEFKIKKK